MYLVNINNMVVSQLPTIKVLFCLIFGFVVMRLKKKSFSYFGNDDIACWLHEGEAREGDGGQIFTGSNNLVAGEENIFTALVGFLIFELNLGSWTFSK